MKLFKNPKKSAFMIILIIIVALGLRSINFSRTLIYASDQGEFLIDGAKILSEKKVRLIGIYVSSKKVDDKYFFIGSQFSYFLAFLQKILGHNPRSIKYVFVMINTIAVVLTYLTGLQLFSKFVGTG